MNALSLFDGISCGQIALNKIGVEVDQYFASEVNKQAIKVTQHNFPNTKQLGDVTKLRYEDGILYSENGEFNVGKIDMVMGGSPCQDLSVYKLNIDDVKGLEGKKSNLFYHFERLLEEIKPKYFLLENVKMDKQWEDIITELLQVDPIEINSNLVCAAERKRNYWSNIPNITKPLDHNIVIGHIIESYENVADKYWYDRDFIYNGDDKKVQCTLVAEKGFQRNMKEVYNVKFKCNTLLADGDGGNRQKKVFQNGRCRKFTPLEYERMQNIPDNYSSIISDSARYSAVGNGWTVDVIAHIFKGLHA